MTRRFITGACVALLALGTASTAHADGVRPDACWTEGELCDNAGSHSGICLRRECSVTLPNECTAGQAGEAGQAGAGEGGRGGGHESTEAGLTSSRSLRSARSGVR